VLRLLVDLTLEARRRRPGLAILVDYPGAHLRLGRVLRELGVRVLQLVAPQRWAWLPWRARSLAGSLDALAVTLPFEEGWFRARGIPATFVGHPLVDLFRPPSRDDARARLGLGAGRVLALLPGSRENELARHLPILASTLPALPADVRTVAAVPGTLVAACRQALPGVRVAEDAGLALAAADAALCCSGSVTLEAALAGVPALVFYRLSAFSHWIARRLVEVPWIALPNLILGEPVLTELVQDQATPRALAAEARRLLDPEVAAAVRRKLEAVRARLGTPGFAARVAELAERLLTRPRS
jgi:lipid-A-disaccharide synthase